MIVGILLTGGTSRRLGTDKALVRVGGQTLARRSAAVLHSVCGNRCVEVGPGHSALRAVREDPPGTGPLAAIVAGLDALAVTAADTVVVLACDLPRVEAVLLELLLDIGGDGAVPEWAGRAQTLCAVYGPRVVAEMRLRHSAGEHSLRWVPASGVTLVSEARWQTVVAQSALHDLDTPDDAADLGITLPEDAPTRP